ncbi:MAG: phosphatidylglycerophosphatase A family protein [bacterium]
MSPVNRIAQAVGTGFFIGYFPIFPATIGSLLGVAIYILLVTKTTALSSFAAGWLLLLGFAFLLAVWAARRCEVIYGADDRHIVIDEVWGMLIGLQGIGIKPSQLLAAFVIFRAIDIIKPYPIRRVERVGGGFGVVLDDGIAGIYTALLMLLIRGLVTS